MESIDVENGTIYISQKQKQLPSVAALLRYQQTKNHDKEEKYLQVLFQQSHPIFKFLGVFELYRPRFYKACFIELFISALFGFAHIGMVLGAISFSYPPLMAGISHGFLVTLFILQFAGASGAHFNGLISFATMCTGHTTPIRCVIYILCQMLGFYIGVECMRNCLTTEQIESISLGGCSLGDNISANQALCIEVFADMLLLCTIYGTALNEKQQEIYGPVLGPIFVGFMIFLVVFMTGGISSGYSGAGMNATLCWGTAASYATNVGESTAFHHAWVYWAGGVIASILHTIIYVLAPPDNLHEHEEVEMNNVDVDTIIVSKDISKNL